MRYNFWLVPAVLVLTAVALATVLIEWEGWLKREILGRWPGVFDVGAEGARGILTTIAGSMITLAGVVFSITLVALSLAASQYSSRLLRNFMSDRVNQSVLGAFVGIFAYCIVVLRTIRGGDEGLFVPAFAVLVALVLGFVGIAVLIYFIHHISSSIQVSHMLETASRETIRAVDNVFPEEGDDEPGSDARRAIDQATHWDPVPAARSGYLQTIDREALLKFATDRKTVVRMERRIGQFVIEGAPVLSIREGNVTSAERRELRRAVITGVQGTVEQDPAFGIRQIVDIALRALSPAMNDPTTAMMCIDRLTAILGRLSNRRVSSHFRGSDGAWRLVTKGPTYAELVGDAFDPLRRNTQGNLSVLDSLLGAIEQLARRTGTDARRRVLFDLSTAMTEPGMQDGLASRDAERIAERSARTLASLAAAETG
jgi:uncharacterized membrane protein